LHKPWSERQSVRGTPPPDTTPADRPTPTMQTTTTWRPRMRLRVAQHSTAHVCHLSTCMSSPSAAGAEQPQPRMRTWASTHVEKTTPDDMEKTQLSDFYVPFPPSRAGSTSALQGLEDAICRFPACLPAEPPPLGSPLFLGRPLASAPARARLKGAVHLETE
jgi:hypothetical protein